MLTRKRTYQPFISLVNGLQCLHRCVNFVLVIKKLYTTARGEREGRQGSQSDETQGGEPLNRQE